MRSRTVRHKRGVYCYVKHKRALAALVTPTVHIRVKCFCSGSRRISDVEKAEVRRLPLFHECDPIGYRPYSFGAGPRIVLATLSMTSVDGLVGCWKPHIEWTSS